VEQLSQILDVNNTFKPLALAIPLAILDIADDEIH
jgi:hypothetical protein